MAAERRPAGCPCATCEPLPVLAVSRLLQGSLRTKEAVWAALSLSCDATHRGGLLQAHSLVALLCSVPPKADADSKDGSNSKADDEEKPKPPNERLQEAVRDSKVSGLKLAP